MCFSALSRDDSSSWCATVYTDLCVVAAFFPDAACDFKDVCGHMVQMGSPSKAIKKVMYSPIFRADVPLKPAKVQSALSFQCHMCSRCFPSNQTRALHLFKVHGVKSDVRLRIDTTHCPVCMLQFHTRERVLNHVKFRSKVCRTYICDGPPILTVEMADALDMQEQESNRKRAACGVRRHKLTKESGPCFRMPGPLISINVSAPSDHHTLGRGRNYHF